MHDRSSDPQTYDVIGAALQVHRELGVGFLEGVYRDALHIELEVRGIPFRAEVSLPVSYRGTLLATRFRADLVCFNTLLVELKARSAIGGPEFAQVINYMKAGRFQKALIINFGAGRLQYRRVVL